VTPDRPADSSLLDRGTTRSWRERWFTGLTWKGVALVALLCLFNALRRSAQPLFDGDVPLVNSLVRLVGMFGTSLIVLLLTTLAVVATYNRAPSAPRSRYPALVLAVLVSSAVGVALLFALESFAGLLKDFGESSGWLGWIRATWARYAVPGLLIAAVFVFFRTAEESDAATHRVELDRVGLAQRMDEARLQMLQAQIEPHFLFNTLANVRRLYQTEPAAAESMLDNLMRYLTVALPQMRGADSTLGREAALTESYLNIQRIRMGRRLAFDIDIPESLREAPVPPMMLLTLAENAIRHGLGPLPEGGFVRVSAHVDGGQLRLQVADSGQGFSKTSGAGTGLANARARLAAMYGQAAQLGLGLNRPRGVIATISLPYATAVPAATAR
jgi:signal transduction histidine kinase